MLPGMKLTSFGIGTMNELKENRFFKHLQQKVPHVAEKIFLLWGYPEFVIYTSKLFTDTRDGQRKGFEKSVTVSIFELMDLHDKEFPQHSKKGDIWGIS